jgi:hypothetical protein
MHPTKESAATSPSLVLQDSGRDGELLILRVSSQNHEIAETLGQVSEKSTEAFQLDR